MLLVLLAGCQRGAAQDPPEAGTAATVASTTASATASAAPPDPDAPLEAPGPALSSDEVFDLLIQGGVVFDGSGARPLRADVVIDGDRIVHIGSVSDTLKADRVIDARGKVVTPGFIDTHAHGDPEGDNKNFLAMGVTTLVVGQDGKSPSEDRIGPWRHRIGKKRLAVNVAPLVGHATVRSLAKVGAATDPSEAQIERMAKLVAKEMDAGAWGLSTGLEYSPGNLATAAELAAIAKPVAERDGLVMSHLRSEDEDKIDDAVDELVAQGKTSGARVHVAHIKLVYGKGTARAEQLLDKLAAARKDGVEVTADIYPYEASYTTISILFPDFAKPPASYKRVRRERREELAAYIRDKVIRRGGPEGTLFGTNPYRGKTLAAVAAAAGKPFEDVIIDDIGLGGASAAYFVMDEAVVSRLLRDPHVMIGTDGSAYSRHPRGYGTFAKVIARYVVERDALSLAEAVRKMTGLPAKTLRFDKLERGLLKKGWAADVLVFDPTAVRDRSDYENPSRYAEGMAWVIVNGRVVVEDGKIGKQRAGRLLLRP